MPALAGCAAGGCTCSGSTGSPAPVSRTPSAPWTSYVPAAPRVVSVGDGFDLQGPHAEVIVAVMAWAAKMERLATAERIAAARER